MNVSDAAELVDTRQDLVNFIDNLREDLVADPSSWENVSISDYLDALSACFRDMPGWLKNQGLEELDQPSWQIVAQMLLAASMYE